jgi:hypothetical protein
MNNLMHSFIAYFIKLFIHSIIIIIIFCIVVG